MFELAALVGAMAIVAIAVFVANRFFGTLQVVMALIVGSLLFLPRTVWSLAPLDDAFVGIAPSVPALKSFTVAAILIAFLVAARTGAKLLWTPIPFLPFLIYMVAMAAVGWSGSSSQWAGVLHFGVALAFGVFGAYLSSSTNRDERSGRTMLGWLTIYVFVELAIVIAQSLGADIFPTDLRTAMLEGARANGSLGHPSGLGKIIVLLMPLVLPFTRATDPRSRRIALLLIAGAIPCFLLTASRTNFAAFVAVLVIWAFLLPLRGGLGKRIVVVGAVATVVVLSADIWVWRASTGEDGSFRQQLLDAAFTQFHTTPWLGVGVNSYVDVVGQWDNNAANGWPVHNSFVLLLVETGLVGVILLAIPAVSQLLQAWRGRHLVGEGGDSARALVATAVGIVAIGLTGWSLLSDSLPIVFLSLGYAVDKVRRGMIEAASQGRAQYPSPKRQEQHRHISTRGN